MGNQRVLHRHCVSVMSTLMQVWLIKRGAIWLRVRWGEEKVSPWHTALHDILRCIKSRVLCTDGCCGATLYPGPLLGADSSAIKFEGISGRGECFIDGISPLTPEEFRNYAFFQHRSSVSTIGYSWINGTYFLNVRSLGSSFRVRAAEFEAILLEDNQPYKLSILR